MINLNNDKWDIYDDTARGHGCGKISYSIGYGYGHEDGCEIDGNGWGNGWAGDWFPFDSEEI